MRKKFGYFFLPSNASVPSADPEVEALTGGGVPLTAFFALSIHISN
jgi:hypothetical protein